ncbi:hypothetical protein [Nocardiopsis sp. NRRL B-16309]|uniref:hypothetical protein n=1 Tax=Nocardiopsis sp. NRRL B-16309 TaxID=1519494 RepID=UPI0006AE5142|nr:hypothetical protein [Nocardiopsis sp. NRRL B-16309]KOX15404.1 hypothetical protein ADL05_15590 [Nocardiopsis sp. NRRL B-16309]
MNAIPATDQPYTLTARPFADPAALVGRWVRLRQERAEYVGVLVHAAPTARAGEWEWTLRTPFEEVGGTGRPSVEPVPGAGQAAPAPARRARAQLRAVRADLVEFAPAGDTGLSRARDLAAADLDQLEWELAARP